jgi:DNA-binding HxlR family transcriptional regulator
MVRGDRQGPGASEAAVAGGDRRSYDVFDRACPSRGVLDDVCGRWGLLALVALADGGLRFNQLRRRVDGISEKMLAQALRALERDGLVTRTAQAVIPPRVDYRLTALGESAAAAAVVLVDWLQAHTDEVLAARLAHAPYAEEPTVGAGVPADGGSRR